MTSSIFDTLGVAMLEHHWTTLLSSAVVCGIIVQLSQVICPILFPVTYPKLQGSKKLNWDGMCLPLARFFCEAEKRQTLIVKPFGRKYPCISRETARTHF